MFSNVAHSPVIGYHHYYENGHDYWPLLKDLFIAPPTTIYKVWLQGSRKKPTTFKLKRYCSRADATQVIVIEVIFCNDLPLVVLDFSIFKLIMLSANFQNFLQCV